jgi:YgiT-type zinc finger domain-containing protein
MSRVGASTETAAIKCILCEQGETRPDTTTLVLQRGAATVVINDVPARVCQNCGEDYVDEQVAERVLTAADTAARTGVRLEIRDFKDA